MSEKPKLRILSAIRKKGSCLARFAERIPKRLAGLLPGRIRRFVRKRLRTAEAYPEIYLQKFESDDDCLTQPDETLLKIAEAYRKLLLFERAITVYDQLLKRDRKNAWLQKRADLLCACGRVDEAAETLDQVKTDRLTENGTRIYSQSRYQVMRAQGRLREAYEFLLESTKWQASTGPGVQLKLAEAERQLGLYDQSHSRLRKHLPKFSGDVSYMLQVAGVAAELNNDFEAQSILRELFRTQKPQAPIFLRYIQLLWQNGDVEELHNVLLKAQTLNMSDPALLKHIREIGYVDDEAARYCEQISDKLLKKAALATVEEQAVYARRFFALDMFEEARSAATKYLNKHALRADAYYVRGACNFYLEDYENSEEDLLRCVSLTPGYFEAYGILLHVLPRKPGGLQKFKELLEIRNQSHPKYRTRGEDGRLGLLDIEGSQLNFMLGDFRTGQKIKQERPVCRFLEHQFPDQYTCRKEPHFTKKKSLLVLGEDGVGDEIRWAQFFPRLQEFYDRIEVVCEPRSLSLLERSFPNIIFHPMKRRLMEAPGGEGDQKSRNVPYFALARVISDSLYSRIEEFSEVRLTSDLVLGMWDMLPDGQPSKDGPGIGSYIVADSAQKSKWSAALNETAGNKVKVGLLWRSSLVNPRRSRHYFKLEDLLHLVKQSRDVQFYSLQHEHTLEERLFCRAFGIEILDEADLFDDFDAVAAITANLDLVIGANSFCAEMAAAVGTRNWMLGSFCNLVYFRLGDSESEIDRLTWNSRIIRIDHEGEFEGTLSEATKRAAQIARLRLDEFVVESKRQKQSVKVS